MDVNRGGQGRNMPPGKLHNNGLLLKPVVNIYTNIIIYLSLS